VICFYIGILYFTKQSNWEEAVARNRYDETWHRLLEWTKGQAASERLAAQILVHAGFTSLDPSHPLGGPDDGKDARAERDGRSFVMAVYFPRGHQKWSAVSSKFRSDVAGAKKSGADGIAFVTNQELTLGQREKLKSDAGTMVAVLFHLERLTTSLDEPSMAKVREQFLDIEANQAPTIQLGGSGGLAPGAGGGGGAALGGNATGGAGGVGGDITLLDGTPGQEPGGGGGGAGVIGEGAIGGEGGGGGEVVHGTIGPEELSGVHHFQFHVGEGGKGGSGEDTIFNLCAEDGTVLRQIRAKGGETGAPAYCPPPNRTPTQADLDAGLKVTSIFAAEFIRMRDGLWTVVDGGWDWIQVSSVPFQQSLPLFIEVGTGRIDPPGTNLQLNLVVVRPDGFESLRETQIITVADDATRRSRFAKAMTLSGSLGGIWHVHVRAGEEVLSDYIIEVRLPSVSN
jgi:hypothetical protein